MYYDYFATRNDHGIGRDSPHVTTRSTRQSCEAQKLRYADGAHFVRENVTYSFSSLLSVFFSPTRISLFSLSSSASYYETFRGPIAAISLAPSARSGRVHAHVKGVVQQAGLKRQVA